MEVQWGSIRARRSETFDKNFKKMEVGNTTPFRNFTREDFETNHHLKYLGRL